LRESSQKTRKLIGAACVKGDDVFVAGWTVVDTCVGVGDVSKRVV